MELEPAARAAILAHARRLAALDPPEEAAGVIANARYIPLENIARDRSRGFALDDIHLKTEGIEAIVHSHPGGPAYPSGHDMRQQIGCGVPWLVAVAPTASRPDCPEEVFGFGGVPKLDLSCGYRHGVDDCYSLIRGYYQTHHGITLPDVPRPWEWWHDGLDLYTDGLGPAGFRRLPPGAALAPGDVFLARVRAPVVNHAGVWLGDGLILHHLGGASGHQPERLPRKEPAERWLKFIDGWARHQPPA
ncbi:MAG: C40 family peptidase [Alphaproteobacteria bacterium]|nr:C40 family peptidase [Alphaproteobacteria bacterium]